MKYLIHYSHRFALILLTVFAAQPLFAQQLKPRKVRTNGASFIHQARTTSNARNNCTRDIYRTINGTCNNLSATEDYGASDIPLYREMKPTYGNPDPLNDMNGQDRISPRAISNLIIDQEESRPSNRRLSSFVFTWGQFLDHDITLTPEGHTEYHPIALPEDEADFQSEIPFFRSEVRAGTGETTVRAQSNLITSWIDASNVYGSDENRANWLRTFSQGKLKTSTGNLLPYNTTDGVFDSPIAPNSPSMAATPTTPEKLFVAGDVRANEQPGLTALHTLFVREHNRICNRLIASGITEDEEIYQRARKHVGAIIQKITFDEFLPALGINLPRYRRYDDEIHPDIMNLFATAAYRLGHTMVTEELLLLDNSCNPVDDNLSLIDGFFNPTQIANYGLAPFLKGLSIQKQEEIDVQMIDGLRNFLFAIPGAPFPFGLDLAALNIQRGRDHGLPSYNQIRDYFVGRRVRDFRDITSNRALRNALEDAYDSPNQIDAWVGLLAEDHLPGKSIGPTLDAILTKQFQRLRDGDFYYYENDPAIDGQLLQNIRNDRLSNVIERNTNLDNLQGNIFFARNCDDMADNPPNGGDNDGPGGNGGPGGGNGGNGGSNDSPGGNNGGNGGPGNGPGGNGGGGNGGPGGGNIINIGGTTSNRIFEQTDFQIAPNPSSGLFNIQAFSSNAPLKELVILGMDGKQHYSKPIPEDAALSYQADFQLDLPSGLYLVQLLTNEGVISKKLVITQK